VMLLLVVQVSTAFGLVSLVICSEIIFILAFVIGLQFRKKLPS